MMLTEQTAPRGSGSPLHVHHSEDEWFYVLEGELTIWVAGQTIVAPAGSFVFGPRERATHVHRQLRRGSLPAGHRRPPGSRASSARSATPAPVAEIPPAPAAPPDMAPVLQAAAEHGLEILGPPGIPA